MKQSVNTDLPPFPRPSGAAGLVHDRLIEFKAGRAEPVDKEAWNNLCVISSRLAMMERVLELERQAAGRAQPLSPDQLQDRAGHLARLCRQLKDQGITRADLNRIGLEHPAKHIYDIHRKLQNS